MRPGFGEGPAQRDVAAVLNWLFPASVSSGKCPDDDRRIYAVAVDVGVVLAKCFIYSASAFHQVFTGAN